MTSNTVQIITNALAFSTSYLIIAGDNKITSAKSKGICYNLYGVACHCLLLPVFDAVHPSLRWVRPFRRRYFFRRAQDCDVW